MATGPFPPGYFPPKYFPPDYFPPEEPVQGQYTSRDTVRPPVVASTADPLQLIQPIAMVPYVVIPEQDTSPITETETFSPVDSNHWIYDFYISDPPTADTDVTVTIRARAMLLASNRRVVVVLMTSSDSYYVGDLFETDGHDCPIDPDEGTLTIPKATWNEYIIDELIHIQLLTPYQPSATCEESFVSIETSYRKDLDPSANASFVTWRSFAPTLVSNRGSDYLFGRWEYDPLHGAMVCAVTVTPQFKELYGGLGASNIEDATADRPGGWGTESVVYGEVRPVIVRFSSEGECVPF
jgi:hypothetical protein